MTQSESDTILLMESVTDLALVLKVENSSYIRELRHRLTELRAAEQNPVEPDDTNAITEQLRELRKAHNAAVDTVIGLTPPPDIEPLPCPACGTVGGYIYEMRDISLHQQGCSGCGIWTGQTLSKTLALQKWNTFVSAVQRKHNETV